MKTLQKMSDKNTAHTSGGIGIFGLLGCIFVTLKLIGTIAWSWWWVLMPFWIIPIIWVAIAVAAFAFIAIFDR